MSFLTKLASAIENTVPIGENTNNVLNYDNYGDFGKKIDRSAVRKYTEEGYLRTSPYFTDTKQLEILTQEPKATVLIKKKLFSSLANNFRPDYMSKEEKLFYKAVNFLFQNKCKQISALEKLSKIEKVISAEKTLSDQLMPSIITLVDSLEPDSFLSPFSKDSFKKLLSVTDRIRKLYAFTNTSKLTTWITSDIEPFKNSLGEGTGVIELTNFTNINCGSTISTNTVKSASLDLEDPYKASLITEFDIEKAISDATNYFYNKKTFQFSLSNINNLIADYTEKLNYLRATRGASAISIRVNPDTFLGKKVTAIVDGVGSEIVFKYDAGKAIGSLFSFNLSDNNDEVQISNDFLENGSALGFEGLSTQTKKMPVINGTSYIVKSSSELSVFKNLISSIFSKLTLEQNSQNAFQLNNENTNYARRKMRAFLLGRCIIQPMDEIRIFISSSSKYDNKVLGGLKDRFSASNLIGEIGKTVYDLKNQFNALVNPVQNLDLKAEKSIFMGSDFPDNLWSLLRDYFVNEKEGVCVFGGVITSAQLNSSTFNNVSISASDNSYYFELGQVNFNPGVDNFNGLIYDPLTPFKSKFDEEITNFKNEIPSLLDENEEILSKAGRNGIVKYKSGPGAGQLATIENFIQDVTINPRTGEKQRSYHAPDGLVYNWKQGIGVFVQSGNSLALNDPKLVGNPNTFANPFAGQDVMNVISLAITGKPYNFINYWRAVQNLEGYGRDPHSNTDAAYSYFNSLKNDLSKNNLLWGNFIPFKTLVMDEQSYAKVLNAQFSIIRNISELENNISELEKIDNALYASSIAISPGLGLSNIDQISQLQIKKNQLVKDTEALKQGIYNADNSVFGLKVIGNDVTFDSNQFLSQENTAAEENANAVRKQLRRKINFLTRRMSWAVRANEDKNLFIVDDLYDKDYDLAAYESALTRNLSLYSNTFTNVKENIGLAASLLNLEVFCDSQGHIRARPPQYNRIPSSVFYRLIKSKKDYKMQLYPKFLDSLFTDQLAGLQLRIEELEDKIRLLTTILGYDSDSSAVSFMNSFQDYGSAPVFTFLTTDSGELSNVQNLIKQSLPEVIDNQNFIQIQNQANSARSFFTTANRFDILLKFTSPEQKAKFKDIRTIFNSNRINEIISRLQTKTGKKIKLDNYLVKVSFGSVDIGFERKNIDIFKITKEISQILSDRQRSVKIFYDTLKNTIESRSIDDDKITNQIFSQGINNSNIPESLEHLIEDETYDDYGPGAGKRFIIKNSQVRNYNISEQPPPYTSVQVSGAFNLFEDIRNQGPAELNGLGQGGNGLTTALAIDYDLWRMYGFRAASPINLPFLSDPESQCGPYASMLLSIARKNILRGSITITGNEYQQPGEVVYIEDLGLLFYVTDVTHSFTVGQDFTTTLTLAYGHAPGDYIPNVLDVVGKVIYKNREVSNFINYRQQNSFNESNIGVVLYDPNSFAAFKIKSDKDEFVSKFAEANAKTITDILYTTAYQLDTNNIAGRKVNVSIELRTYYSNSIPASNNLRQLKENVFQILTGKQEVYKESSTGELKISIDKEFIITGEDSEINLDNEEDFRSPSQKAISAARNVVDSSSVGQVDRLDKIKYNLINNVIDCWIKFQYSV